MQIKLIISLVLALLLVIFAVQNPTTVNIKFLGWQTGEIHLIIVILLAVLIGALLGTILGWPKHRELKEKLKQKDQGKHINY
ncbi:MAG: lipopolysaccharide assembly protein LapA domain-containing protein [bacterium]